jgi:hypothetical protein
MKPDLRRLWCRLSIIPVLALGLGVWLWHGARLGFWVTSVEKRVEAPVVPGMPELGTMETLIWEDRFLSGIETLVATLALALSLWGISFLFSDTNRNPNESSRKPS